MCLFGLISCKIYWLSVKLGHETIAEPTAEGHAGSFHWKLSCLWNVNREFGMLKKTRKTLDQIIRKWLIGWNVVIKIFSSTLSLSACQMPKRRKVCCWWFLSMTSYNNIARETGNRYMPDIFELKSGWSAGRKREIMTKRGVLKRWQVETDTTLDCNM